MTFALCGYVGFVLQVCAKETNIEKTPFDPVNTSGDIGKNTRADEDRDSESRSACKFFFQRNHSCISVCLSHCVPGAVNVFVLARESSITELRKEVIGVS